MPMDAFFMPLTEKHSKKKDVGILFMTLVEQQSKGCKDALGIKCPYSDIFQITF